MCRLVCEVRLWLCSCFKGSQGFLCSCQLGHEGIGNRQTDQPADNEALSSGGQKPIFSNVARRPKARGQQGITMNRLSLFERTSGISIFMSVPPHFPSLLLTLVMSFRDKKSFTTSARSSPEAWCKGVPPRTLSFLWTSMSWRDDSSLTTLASARP